MATLLKANLFILSIILPEFTWLHAAKTGEKFDYECPSVPVVAIEAEYNLKAYNVEL